jgi:hypothetical protein
MTNYQGAREHPVVRVRIVGAREGAQQCALAGTQGGGVVVVTIAAATTAGKGGMSGKLERAVVPG